MKSLITQRVKIGELEGATGLLEFATSLTKSPSFPEREAGEVELIRKFFVDEKAEKVQEGQIRHVISTSSVDRDKEIMLAKGADFKTFRKNPIVLWGHDYREPGNIIGRNVSLTREPELIRALTEFDLEAGKAADVYRLYQKQFLKAWSVGFISMKGTRPSEGPVQYIHEKWAMLEYSAVGVPANPDALTEAVGKGFNLSAELITDLELIIEGLEIEEDNDVKYLDLGTIGAIDDDGKPGQKDEEKTPEKETPERTPPGDADGGHEDPAAGGTPEADELTSEEVEAKFIGAAVAHAHLQKLPEDQVAIVTAWADAPGLEDFSYTKNESGLWDIKADGRSWQMDGEFTWVPREDGTGDSSGYPWGTATIPIVDPYKDYTPYVAPEPGNIEVTKELWDDMAANIKSLRDEIADFKAGRVLSAKNRTLITKATDAMRAAVEALEGLLAATEEDLVPEPDKNISLGDLLKKEQIDIEKIAEGVNELLDIDALVDGKLKKTE